MIHFYSSYSTEKKRELRAMLLKTKANRKEQIKIVEDTLIKPLKDYCVLVDDVLKSKEPMEKVIKRNEELYNLISGIFKAV